MHKLIPDMNYPIALKTYQHPEVVIIIMAWTPKERRPSCQRNWSRLTFVLRVHNFV